MSVADSITSSKQFEGGTDLRVSLGPLRGVREKTDRQMMVTKMLMIIPMIARNMMMIGITVLEMKVMIMKSLKMEMMVIVMVLMTLMY